MLSLLGGIERLGQPHDSDIIGSSGDPVEFLVPDDLAD